MKNSPYFRHDAGARNDPKIVRLVRKKGAIAKAIYWDLVEMLFEEGGKLPMDAINDVMFTNHLRNNSIVNYVVYDSGLFEYDDKFFWSPRQQRDLIEIESIKESRRLAGKASGEKRRLNKNEQVFNKCSTSVQHKIKENNNISISPKGSIDISPSHGERTLESENEIETLFDDQNNGDNITNRPDSSSPENDSSAPILTPRQCQNVIDFWNRTIDETKAVLPKVKTLGDERIKKIRIRWKEFSGIGDPVEVTRVIFRNACMSKFFQGDNPRGWSGNFDWIFTNSKNWAKIYEGNYNDKNQPTEKPATNGLSFEEAKRKQMEAEERDKKAALARLTQRT